MASASSGIFKRPPARGPHSCATATRASSDFPRKSAIQHTATIHSIVGYITCSRHRMKISGGHIKKTMGDMMSTVLLLILIGALTGHALPINGQTEDSFSVSTLPAVDPRSGDTSTPAVNETTLAISAKPTQKPRRPKLPRSRKVKIRMGEIYDSLYTVVEELDAAKRNCQEGSYYALALKECRRCEECHQADDGTICPEKCIRYAQIQEIGSKVDKHSEALDKEIQERKADDYEIGVETERKIKDQTTKQDGQNQTFTVLFVVAFAVVALLAVVLAVTAIYLVKAIRRIAHLEEKLRKYPEGDKVAGTGVQESDASLVDRQSGTTGCCPIVTHTV